MNRSLIFRLAILICAAAPSLMASRATATDYCRFYEDLNFYGDEYTAYLPGVEDSLVDDWSSTSYRRSAEDFAGYHTEGHTQLYGTSSVHVHAIDSDVTLYLYTGDHFDGTVYPFDCPRGSNCWISDLGWLEDSMGSFICQREYPAGLDDLEFNTVELPTLEIAEGFDGGIRASVDGNGDIDHNYPQYTRASWSTAYDRCVENDVLDCPAEWYHKYYDELWLHHYFIADTDPPGPDPLWSDVGCQATVDLWLSPELIDGGYQVIGSAWAVNVWGCNDVIDYVMTQNMAVQLAVQMVVAPVDIYLQTVFGVREAIAAEACPEEEDPDMCAESTLWPLFLFNKDRLQMTHVCDDANFIEREYLEAAGGGADGMWDVQLDDPCLYGFATDAYAPVIRLNYGRRPADVDLLVDEDHDDDY